MVEDDGFRDALLKALVSSSNTNEELKEELNKNLQQQTIFISEQRTLEKEIPNTDKIRVDIFYLEETEQKHNSKAKAEKILQSINPDKYSVRLRILPKLTNAKRAYSIYNNQIRYESNEESIAQDLKNSVEGVWETTFLLYKVRSKTPDYLSIFVHN